MTHDKYDNEKLICFDSASGLVTPVCIAVSQSDDWPEC